MRPDAPTRDETLPAAYSLALEKHALGPLGTALHALRPRERASRAVPHQWRWTAAGAVYHVIEGEGESDVGEARFTWAAGDTFVAPPWTWVVHRNPARVPACLFQLADGPAVRSLGLWAEEVPT